MTLHLHSKRFRLTLIFIAVLFCTGCPSYENTPNPQAEFGADADYFMGLRFLQEGKEKQARLKFTNCLNKGSYYCVKRSGEQLIQSGTMAEKTVPARFFFQNSAMKKLSSKCAVIIQPATNTPR